MHDPYAQRPIPRDLWLRAKAFSKLFGSKQLQTFLHEGTIVNVCWERTAPKDVAGRPVITHADARKLADLRLAMRRGDAISYQDLKFFQSGRVFRTEDGHDFCSCSGFPDNRRCLHTLGRGLSRGALTLPPAVDDTLISTVGRAQGDHLGQVTDTGSQ